MESQHGNEKNAFGQACRDLLAASQAGDRAAVAQAMRRLYPGLTIRMRKKVTEVAIRHALGHEGARDLYSETVARVYEGPPRPRPGLTAEQSVLSYAFTVMRSVALEMGGRTEHRRAMASAEDVDALQASKALTRAIREPDTLGPETRVIHANLLEKVRDVIETLGGRAPDTLQEILDGTPVDEVARATSLSTGTIMNQRSALRRALLREVPELALNEA